MSHPSPIVQLTREWRRTATGDAARAAATRWAATEPALAPFPTPAAMVDRCNDRHARDESHAILRGLLRLADDPWAARTILQAVMPALVTISNRYDDLTVERRPEHRAVWQTLEELDQQVVATAYEVIYGYAGRDLPWPANHVVTATRLRMRRHVSAELRRQSRLVLNRDPASVPVVAPPPRTDAEELALAIVGAVQGGSIDFVDAGLVYCTRIRGERVEDIVPVLGHNWRWGYRHRAQAESVLIAEAFGEDPREPIRLTAPVMA